MAHSRRGGRARYVAGALAIAALAVAGYLAWLALGPGPLDFATRQRGTARGSSGATPISPDAVHPSTARQAATGVPPELATSSAIERGRYLARAADCVSCHTAESGQPFAGGRAFVLPFGTLYSTNITPDPQSGIGAYSDAQFLRAMHDGVARDGTRLYPAMPFAAFTYMSDADALAIKAYLFSLAPVPAPRPVNTLRFPFNQRWLMAVWSRLFNPAVRFEPDPARSAEWNRGAYLAEALAHCGECHTPRNALQALDNRRKFGGARQAGWRAYNLTPDPVSGIGGWSPTEVARFIAAGHSDGHGSAGGPMGEAVEGSLRYLTAGDLAALVTYLESVPALPTGDLPPLRSSPAPAAHDQGVNAALDPRGKEIFESVCVSCHDWTGVNSAVGYATLTGSRAVNDPTANNIVQMVLAGSPREGAQGAFMPGFGAGYTDSEVAAVANYVTARFGSLPSHVSAAEVADLRRQVAR